MDLTDDDCGRAVVDVISASGMATGGRVLRRVEQRFPDERNTVHPAGFQAAGTRRRALPGGAREVRFHGEAVPVRAEVAVLGAPPAHADRMELPRWARSFDRPRQQVFVVHGEPRAARVLAPALETEPGWPSRAARHGELAEQRG